MKKIVLAFIVALFLYTPVESEAKFRSGFLVMRSPVRTMIIRPTPKPSYNVVPKSVAPKVTPKVTTPKTQKPISPTSKPSPDVPSSSTTNWLMWGALMGWFSNDAVKSDGEEEKEKPN